MACCLQVENLTKSFGDLVLFENISFAIEDGRRVALVAKNGTGKYTLTFFNIQICIFKNLFFCKRF